jgi:uncharacterized protein YecE (DUF72 family)
MVGPPVWACDAWRGDVYPRRVPRNQWLRWYSSAFNTVEGNSTFYGIPSETTVRKWAEQSADGFRFCFKFPRQISHERKLRHCDQPLTEFLRRLEILKRADRLGPTFLQLGPSFGPERFGDLEMFLRSLPRDFSWALELRHQDWFDGDHQRGAITGHESRVDDLLRSLSVNKVLFDSRPLFQSLPDDPIEAASQQRKPRTPVRQTVTAGHPMLRIVGRNQIELAEPYFAMWAAEVAKWARVGLKPYIFTHAPDDANAPALARLFLDRLREHLPEFGVTDPVSPVEPRQLRLLD